VLDPPLAVVVPLDVVPAAPVLPVEGALLPVAPVEPAPLVAPVDPAEPEDDVLAASVPVTSI
jgi:hypothetical protein